MAVTPRRGQLGPGPLCDGADGWGAIDDEADARCVRGPVRGVAEVAGAAVRPDHVVAERVPVAIHAERNKGRALAVIEQPWIDPRVLRCGLQIRRVVVDASERPLSQREHTSQSAHSDEEGNEQRRR